eukprot:gene16019-17636_t
MFNCAVLAFDEPMPENDESKLNKIAEKIEYYFLAIFVLEAVVKIIAMGFFMHPKSYLRSGWNIVDFIVVITGLITLKEISGSTNSNVNIKALRAVRVLRPLKLISGIPSLQVVMTSVVRAMLPLLQVLFLVVFVIIIYAIIGLEFLKGRFHFACYSSKLKEWKSPVLPCDENIGKKRMFIYGRNCPTGYTCQRYVKGLNSGITSFDNIFLSMLTVFQCVTMEGWTEVMYNTFYAIDEHGYIYSLYYVSLIVIGSFFMLNLVLGVLSGEFAKEREKVENRRNFLKFRKTNQMDRQYNHYIQWVMKGEEVMVSEKSNEASTSSDAVRDGNGDPSLKPAVVFTTNRYRFNSATDHRKSKFDRICEWVKNSRIKVRVFVKHAAFYWTVIVMVFLNTVIVATNHYKQPLWLTMFQDYSEIVFVVIFTAEMLLKFYGLGPSHYFHSMFNVFDCVVVSLSILELLINRWFNEFNLGLSVMRSLRLLRIFKVTKYWSSLRNLISSLMNGMKSILSLMFLLFLFIVISALLGMQLFGGKFAKFDEYPRTNFDTFADSLLAVFQIMTGEDWNAVMYNGMNAYGGPKNVAGILFSLYFVFLVIFGNYTLLNVFLAIAVDNLTNAEILSQDEEEEQDAVTRQKTARTGMTGPGTHWTKLKALSFVRSLQRQVEENEMMQNGADGAVLANSSASDDNEKIKIAINGFLERRENNDQIQKKWKKILQNQPSIPIVVENTVAVSEDQNRNIESEGFDSCHIQTIENGSGDNSRRGSNISSIIKDEGLLNYLKMNVAERRRIHKPNPAFREVSLFIFSSENPIRKFCHAVVHHKFFDPFIMFVIFISSLTLAIEDPVDDKNPRNAVLQWFDYVFAGIFSVEVILKVIDFGFILHKGAYLRDPWNVLDAFVVACNISSLVISAKASQTRMTQTVKALRVLRVLRPLKAISKVKKLKAVFQCMIFSLKNVAFVLIITLLFLFIFACIGVQLFKGKFYYCTDPSKMTETDCQGKYYDFPSRESVLANTPDVKTRIWKPYDFHFDNVFEAMLTLYTSSTGEGWPTSMHRTIDATSAGQGPIRNNRPYMAIYFVTFVIVFTFMIINIYVALIILTFQRQGEKELTEGGLDRNQRDCIHYALTSKARQRYMPHDKHSFSYRVWYVVDSRPFEYCIMLFIGLNTFQLMMQYDGADQLYKDVLQGLNITFTVLFCFEAALKIIAYRISYFKDGWNLFDFLVVLGSVLDIILTVPTPKVDFIDPSMFRLCRAARIIKLLRSGTSIRLMLWTFLQSFKALPYVTALIMLLFYMYGVIGMQLFAKIRIQTGSDAVITEYNNFRSIIQALQVLFRSATGENWNSIMRACYDDALCDTKFSKPGQLCGNKYLAIFYFGTFIFLCMFLLLNLFVAVIMDNFEYLTRDSSILGPHHLDEFARVWSEYDPTASGRIHHQELYALMCNMAPPVGFGKKCPKALGYKRLIRMNMPVGGDQTGDAVVEEPVVGTPSVFKRIISSFRRRGSKRPSNEEEEAIELQSKPSDFVFKKRPASFRRSDSRADQQLTREGKRRSSWHDLGSLFRQKESATIDNAGEATQTTTEVTDSMAQSQSTQAPSTVIQNRNTASRDRLNMSNSNPAHSSKQYSSGNSTGSSQLAHSSRQHPGNYRPDMNRNTGAHFSGSRNQGMRASGPRSSSASGSMYSTGKPVQRSLSGGAVDYQRSGAASSLYRLDNRAVHSPNYSRSGTSSSKQTYQSPLVGQPGASAMHGLSNNSSSHHSIQSLPGANLSATSGNNINNSYNNISGGSLPFPITRSAPASVDSHLNDSRHHGSASSWQGKPTGTIWHSGPPFYGPASSNDASQNSSQQVSSGRSFPAKQAGNYNMPSNSSQFSASPAMRQGGSYRGSVNSDDCGVSVYEQQKHQDARMTNQMNASTSNGIAGQNRGQAGKLPRSGNPMVKEQFEEEEDLLNGRQTQQYYDQMIAQINDKIAKVVERGQSPYSVYAGDEGEENDWC